MLPTRGNVVALDPAFTFPTHPLYHQLVVDLVEVAAQLAAEHAIEIMSNGHRNRVVVHGHHSLFFSDEIEPEQEVIVSTGCVK